MPVTRILNPKPDDVFFHYCSTDTFLAICEHKRMRFSDINMMNDAGEAKYSYRIFEESATKLLNDERLVSQYESLNVDFFDRVDKIISPQQLRLHPVIACFSRDPDVLSQWRAYANDGKGFSIGFSGDLLNALPATLLDVEYRPETQIAEMSTSLLAIYLKNIQSKDPFGADFKQDCILLGSWMLGFKHPSFAEEKEIRCLHLLDVVTDDERPRLIDTGGESRGKKVDGCPVKYRNADGAIVAYIDVPLPSEANEPLIRQVWLGPKNENGPGNIIYMMSGFGLKDYLVRVSSSTYR